MTINDTLINALTCAGQRICKPRFLGLQVQKTMALAPKSVSSINDITNLQQTREKHYAETYSSLNNRRGSACTDIWRASPRGIERTRKLHHSLRTRREVGYFRTIEAAFLCRKIRPRNGGFLPTRRWRCRWLGLSKRFERRLPDHYGREPIPYHHQTCAKRRRLYNRVAERVLHVPLHSRCHRCSGQ